MKHKHMSYKQAKCMNGLNLRQWNAKVSQNDEHSMRMSNLYMKTSFCGTKAIKSNGFDFTNQCRAACCPDCSWKFSVAQADLFLKRYSTLEHKHLRMMTVVIGLTTSIDEVPCMFDRFRLKLREGVNNKRRSSDPKASFWKRFGIIGNCEIDSFMPEDFESLGTKKKKQYTELLGYQPELHRSEPVWIVTGHFSIYKGRLSLREIEELVRKQAPYVHFRKTDTDQDVPTAVRSITGYSAKVSYQTHLADLPSRIWTNEQMQAYLGLISSSKGRKSFGFAMKPRN